MFYTKLRSDEGQLSSLYMRAWKVVSYNAALFVLALFFYSSFVFPASSLVFKVQLLFQYCGFVLVVFLPINRTIIRLAIYGESSDMKSLVTPTLRNLAGYSAVLWAIGYFGDDVKEWVDLNHESAIAVLVASVIILLVATVQNRLAGFVFVSESGGKSKSDMQ